MKTTKNKIIYEQEINNIKGKASMVVFPDSIEEIKRVVLTNEDIVPRGGGTSLVGGCVAFNSVIIDTSKMNNIIEINAGKKTALIEPGVILDDLNAELEKYDLEFPVETMFSGVETIGGLIAKNSSGKNEIKYGKIISWINSLEVVNGKGELIKVSKSDLSDFAGMEGITGIITKASLRLTNKKKRSISILKSDKLSDIYEASKRIKLEQEVCSVTLINRYVSNLLGLENKYHIFVEFEGDKGNFKKKEYTEFIKKEKRIYKSVAMEGFVYIENCKIFSGSIEDFLIYVEQNKIPYFSHIASGVFYCFFRQEEAKKREDMLEFIRKLKGKASYCFGSGLTRKNFLQKEEADIIRRVKRRHDPNSKFNKNKLIDLVFKYEKKEQIKETFLEKVVIQNQTPEEKEEIKEEKNSETISENQIINPRTQRDIIEEKEMTEEEKQEKEKIKKIASGLFGAGAEEENKENNEVE